MPIDYTRTTLERYYLIEGTLTHIQSKEHAVDMNDLAIKGFAGFAAMAGAANYQVQVSGVGKGFASPTVRAQDITCEIDGKPMTGNFTGTRLLQEGDKVRAVVSDRDIGTYIHAIQRTKDGLLWLPVFSQYGRAIAARFYGKFAAILYLVLLIFFAIFLFIMGSAHHTKIGETLWIYKWTSVICAVLMLMVFLFQYWMYFPLCVKAEKCFRLLGFPDVKRLNFTSANFLLFHADAAKQELRNPFPDFRFVFYYQPAIDAHMAKTKVSYTQLPSPEAALDPPDIIEELEQRSKATREELKNDLEESLRIVRERNAKDTKPSLD